MRLECHTTRVYNLNGAKTKRLSTIRGCGWPSPTEITAIKILTPATSSVVAESGAVDRWVSIADSALEFAPQPKLLARSGVASTILIHNSAEISDPATGICIDDHAIPCCHYFNVLPVDLHESRATQWSVLSLYYDRLAASPCVDEVVFSLSFMGRASLGGFRIDAGVPMSVRTYGLTLTYSCMPEWPQHV